MNQSEGCISILIKILLKKDDLIIRTDYKYTQCSRMSINRKAINNIYVVNNSNTNWGVKTFQMTVYVKKMTTA